MTGGTRPTYAAAIDDPGHPETRPRDLAALGLLALATALYTGVNLYRLDHFYGLDYDLAIFGQGLWLLSRGESPLVTVRGMHLLGEHATFVHLLLAPFYRLLGPLLDVRFLVLVQSAALALTGALLHGIARRALGRGAAFLVLSAYLFYPPLQYTWLEYYEPIALALPCLVAAHEAVREGRDRRALLWSGLALISIENLAVTVAALGLYASGHGRRRLGVILITGAALYVAFVMAVVFPWLHAGGYVYGGRLYGDFAGSLPEALRYLARPDRLLARLGTAPNGRYLLGLLVPVAFLPLAAPATLALAAQLPLNMISSWPYAHEIRYHYVAPIVPFVFLAVVRALARFPPRSPGRRWAVRALLVGLVGGQLLYAPPWLRPSGGAWRTAAADDAERREMTALLERLPPDAALSVHYRFLPHLAHRRSLYMFPETGPDWPDALLLDVDRIPTDAREGAALRRCQEEGGFREALRAGKTVLFLRLAAPGVTALRLALPREARPATPPGGLAAAPDRR